MKVLAIVQARMSSTRLPQKVLADINGKPMLQHLLDRIGVVSEIDHLVVATSESRGDDQLASWLKSKGVSCFRGSEDDVLSRFYLCAQKFSPEFIVRITADDPLKDPGVISKAIRIIQEDSEMDYCSNTLKPTYPEGIDIEVFRLNALKTAYDFAVTASDREHVTPYIWRHPEKFRLYNFENNRDLSSWRWTVDKPADLEFICKIYDHFQGEPLVPFLKIVEFIDSNPELLEINKGTVRNEGYLKSLELNDNG